MKQECVLVLGTLNGSKIRIVNELVKLDKKVVVIDTENGRNLKYPPNVTPYFVSSMDEKTILDLVKVISEVYEITHAGNQSHSSLKLLKWPELIMQPLS